MGPLRPRFVVSYEHTIIFTAIAPVRDILTQSWEREFLRDISESLARCWSFPIARAVSASIRVRHTPRHVTDKQIYYHPGGSSFFNGELVHNRRRIYSYFARRAGDNVSKDRDSTFTPKGQNAMRTRATEKPRAETVCRAGCSRETHETAFQFSSLCRRRYNLTFNKTEALLEIDDASAN